MKAPFLLRPLAFAVIAIVSIDGVVARTFLAGTPLPKSVIIEALWGNQWGEGDFGVGQNGATARIKAQGVQQNHLGITGQRADAK